MKIAEIKAKQGKVVSQIIDGQIATTLPLLSELVYASRNGDFITNLENLEGTYTNILKYSFGQTEDPQREVIYKNLKRQLIELCDNVSYHIIATHDEWISSLRKQDASYLSMGEQEKSALIDQLISEFEFSTILEEISPSDTAASETSQNYSSTVNKVFDILFLKGKYTEGEIQLAQKLLDAEGIPWYDKALMVSAISISLINHFDHAKVDLLFYAYSKGETQITQRALVGLIFTFLTYYRRLDLYPEITNQLKSISDIKTLAKQTEQIIIQFIKAQETEKVTQKIQNEIIPEVMKIKPDIEEKLRLDDLISKDEIEDKNPDWEDFFSDAPDVYKKLEEFSMMQMDGSDVFMGAFSMLKRFGFFEKFSNWFLPFYKEHPEVQKSVSDVDDKFDWNTFFEGIEQAPVMCNSDKYSFCFNIGFMPDMQKSMMLEMFSSELKQMSEISEDEQKHDANTQNRIIFTQYIQDLYRFYNLHPKRDHFNNVFNLQLDVSNTRFLKDIFEGTDNLRKIGEFYFNKNYYTSALTIFEKIAEQNKSFELIEKIGFCYQKLNQFKTAIDYYKEAEVYDNKRLWLQKKLGYCYRKTNKFDKAIEYYKQVEIQEPDNLEIQASLGQLNIDKEDYQEALKYYFKVEYLKPDFVKVQRPIGWCSFMLGKTEQAIRYFKKVIEKDGQRSDFLNLAHTYWVNGSLGEAIENYKLALKHSGNDNDWFRNSMEKDSTHLKKCGIDELEIRLMVDYAMLDV